MKIIPYGGVNEIGGNSFLLESNSTRIMLDFGRSFKREGTYFEGFLLPRTFQGLKDFLEFDILPKFEGLYAQRFEIDDEFTKPSIDACFLSHAHLDHFGNLNLLHDDIPVYMGETAATIIQSIQDTTRTRFNRPYIRPATDDYPSNVRTFRTGDIIQIPNFEVTPIHVDHSLPGSYGFIIKGNNGYKIGYTGDIRLHGWRKDLTRDFIEIAKGKNLNALLIEGTNINEDFDMNERSVQKELSESIVKTNGLAIANYSLRDIDRFRSFYIAAKENGRKLLINVKQAYLIQLLQEDPHLEIPGLNDPYIKIYKRPKRKYYRWEKKVFEKHFTVETPDFDQTEYVFHCDFWNLTDLIDIQPKPKESTFFYSHGEPFNEEGMIDYNRMMEWITHFHLDIKQYHASGHAPQSDLKTIVDEIQPQLVIPIHTEHPEMYREIVDVPILLPARNKSISI
ncbi:MAG: MBL fold metallo-hydrolase [Candidatus Hodarchaeales archaeon]|jgi:ribonuclease J